MKKKFFSGPLLSLAPLIPACWILFNPNLNLIDLLPDCIAYALILLALRRFSDLVPHMADACDAFRKLFYVTLAKVPATFLMFFLASERVTITLFAFSFALLELIWLYPAYRSLFEGILYLGERFAAVEDLDRKDSRGIDSVRTVTFLFVTVKAAMSTLPEFAFLFTYDSLSDSGVTNNNRLYLWMAIFGFLIALVIGILWLSSILPFLRGIAKGLERSGFSLPETLEKKEEAKQASLLLSLPCLAFATGLVFAIDLSVDGRIFFPDYLAAAFLLVSALLLFLRRTNGSLPALIGCGGYLLATIGFAIARAAFLHRYSTTDIHRVDGAFAAYLPMMIFSLLSEVLLVLSVLFLGRALFAHRRSYPGADPLMAETSHLQEVELSEAKRPYRILMVLTVISALFSFTHILLDQFTRAVETNPGHGGQLIYLPTYEAFYFLPLLAGILLAIWGVRLAREHLSALHINDESGD